MPGRNNDIQHSRDTLRAIARPLELNLARTCKLEANYRRTVINRSPLRDLYSSLRTVKGAYVVNAPPLRSSNRKTHISIQSAGCKLYLLNSGRTPTVNIRRALFHGLKFNVKVEAIGATLSEIENSAFLIRPSTVALIQPEHSA
jgi:hypothetical protein